MLIFAALALYIQSVKFRIFCPGHIFCSHQPCQMVYFRSKNTNIYNIYIYIYKGHLEHFTAICNTLNPFAIPIYLQPFGNLWYFFYIYPHFGRVHREKIWQPWFTPVIVGLECLSLSECIIPSDQYSSFQRRHPASKFSVPWFVGFCWFGWQDSTLSST
jgi:hypothetical protein